MLQPLQDTPEDHSELFRIFLFFCVGISLLVILKIGMGYYQLKSEPVEPFRHQVGYWKV